MKGKPLKSCSGCPRTQHYHCLPNDLKPRAKAKFQFMCSQHRCADCLQNTQNAGGMLFRCRWCENAYCEDCLNWESARLIGPTLKEFGMLTYPEKNQAYFVVCHDCNENQEAQITHKRREFQIEKEYELYRQKTEREESKHDEDADEPQSPDSYYERTTAETSAATTPPSEIVDDLTSSKRKASSGGPRETGTPSKRPRRSIGTPLRSTIHAS